MASLYRKWRPQNFSDVVGQEHIKKTLLNALRLGRVSHAYLFTGPRGTGKTTMARLLAKSINCEVRPKNIDKSWDGEPCNKCSSCREIVSGQSLDVIEIDAASNRGIEEIRELRDKIKFSPAKSRYKVFIIDEVHMLTKEAFNALLKTLEEPPAHAIFILATTEAHKMPATIISRCQRYDFQRAQIKEIESNISKVAKGEKLLLDEAAIKLLARMADGSYRDGLSILDQVAAVVGAGEKLSSENIREILGLASVDMTIRLFQMIGEGRKGEALKTVGELVEKGVNISYLMERLVDDSRQLLLIKSQVDEKFIESNWDSEEKESWLKIADMFQGEELLEILKDLISAAKDIKYAPLPQLPLEIVIMKHCRGKVLENKLAGDDEQSGDQGRTVKVQDLTRANDSGDTSQQVDAVTSADTEVVNKPVDTKLWDSILQKIRPHNHSLYALLKDAVPISAEIDKIILGVRFRFHAERLYDKKNRPIIEKIIEEVIGRPVCIECRIDDKLPKPQAVREDELLTSVVEVFGMEE